jgi:hypothetical protein
MSRRTKVLVVFLRIAGVGGLFALAAVVMPMPWMAAIHRWLGLGEMPTGPVVEYLARRCRPSTPCSAPCFWSWRPTWTATGRWCASSR